MKRPETFQEKPARFYLLLTGNYQIVCFNSQFYILCMRKQNSILIFFIKQFFPNVIDSLGFGFGFGFGFGENTVLLQPSVICQSKLAELKTMWGSQDVFSNMQLNLRNPPHKMTKAATAWRDQQGKKKGRFYTHIYKLMQHQDMQVKKRKSCNKIRDFSL